MKIINNKKVSSERESVKTANKGEKLLFEQEASGNEQKRFHHYFCFCLQAQQLHYIVSIGIKCNNAQTKKYLQQHR